jgi:hypothetical protein
MTKITQEMIDEIDIGQLRQRVINIKSASKGRIALFTMIEHALNNPELKVFIDHALNVAEE